MMMSGLLPPLSSRTSGGVSPTCCCSTSLDRCDLLVGLEGFHLIAVARRACGLILDMESCDHFSGCPGCGVITQGYGCVVVEVVDAPWAGVPARIRWHRRRWICREHTRETRCTHKTGCSTEQRGGIALHGGPTRRRHAVRRLHVVQTPTTSGVEGAVGIAHLAGVPPSAKEHAQHGNYSKSKRSRPLLRTHIFHVKPPAPMLASPG